MKRLSIAGLVAAVTLAGIFAMALRVSVDTDSWWHLRAGEWMLDNRALLREDVFSHTRYGAAWEYPGWLVEIPMALIYRAAGPGGLNVWTALMVTLAFMFIWQASSGGVFLRAFALILAATAAGVYWAARPYLVTFTLAAVFLSILEQYRWKRDAASQKRLIWLPILMVVWANSHGGFAAGFLLWGVYWAGALKEALWAAWRRRRVGKADIPTGNGMGSEIGPPRWLVLGLAGAAMVAGVCFNPFGAKMLLYPFKTVGIEALQAYIQEWQSPNFHLRQVQPFAWLILLTLAAAGASLRRMALTDFLLVGGLGYMGLLAGRNIALFALAAPIVLTRHAAPLVEAWLEALRREWGLRLDTRRTPTRREARLNLGILILVLLAVLAKASLTLPRAANEVVIAGGLPTGAVEYLRTANPPGRLFNSYNWGGYLMWALPEYPVFIDGRTDLYDDELVEEWLRITRAEAGWEEALAKREARLILIERDAPLVKVLPFAGWERLYEDEKAVVYGEGREND
ncbi:MAG: hypothetical protein L0Z70_14565 [Chloroflexi bacterium]|nr:hypothetical protein [Chloroflexota bacterium]